MRVCLVGPAYPFRGGIAHFTTILAREFEKDHEVFLVNFRRLYPGFLFPGRTQFDDSNSPFFITSTRIIDTLNPFSFWRAARAIVRFHPDLVLFQWWQPFFGVAYATIVFLLKRKIRSPIVFVCHNVLPHEASPFDRLLIRIGFGQVKNFLVQSEEDNRNLQKLKKNASTAVHPHPIYDVFKAGNYTRDSARKELAVSGRMILFFGYVRPYKGLGVLLRAHADSLRKIDSTLYIVGEFYEDKSRYLSMIQDLGIQAKVVIVDRYVANEEVEKYFVACDVVVLPYLSATQSGIVQVAYGFDKPVIVSSVGGLPDVVADGVTGYVVPPNDPRSLADAMVKYFHERRAEEMTANVRKTKGRFSWAKCKEIIVEFADLLKSGEGRPAP